MAIELASKAGLAETRGGALGANGEAMDKLFSHHRAQIVEIDMPTALVPKGEVLIAGGGGRERSLRLGDSVALEVADIVLVDMGLEAQLSLVIEECRRQRELDSVGLLLGEVENGQQVASQVRDMEHIMEDDGRGQNSIHSSWLEHHRPQTRRVDYVRVGESNGDRMGRVGAKPVPVGCHMR